MENVLAAIIKIKRGNMEKLNQFETMSLLELRSNSHTYYFDRNCFYEDRLSSCQICGRISDYIRYGVCSNCNLSKEMGAQDET